MKYISKSISLILALLMVLSLAACGTGTPAEEHAVKSETTSVPNSEATKDKLTVLKVMSGATQTGFIEDFFIADIWKEEMNIGVETAFIETEKLQTLMASGSLYDITVFQNSTDYLNAVKAGLLVNLDEHKEKLPNLFSVGKNSLQYLRDNVSDGTGNAYGCGTWISNELQTVGNPNSSINIRWDYYKELGYPQIATFEDLLPVMKQMQDAHPTNDNGQKVYAFSLHPEWDSVMCFAGTVISPLFGYCETNSFMEVNNATQEVKSILEENSTYFRALNFFYKANQMGILDPDSLTQTWNDVWEKMGNGRILTTYWSWGADAFNSQERADQGIGFRNVIPDDFVSSMHGVSPQYIGGGHIWAISASTKHLDKALEFTDWNYSYEGVWKLNNGKQGVLWDLDENNEPYITKQGYEILATADGIMPGGGSIYMARSLINAFGPDKRSNYSKYNNRRIDREDWIKKDFAPALSALDLDWQKFYDAESTLEYLVKNNMYATPKFAPQAPEDDEIAQLKAKIAEIIIPYSWRMIFAKNDAEYESIKAEMIKKATGLGIDKVNQNYLEAYMAAVKLGEKYSK